MYTMNEYNKVINQVCSDTWTDGKLLWYLSSLTYNLTSRKLREGEVLVLLQNRIQFNFDITESSLAVFIKNMKSITMHEFTLWKLIFMYR